MAQNVLIGTNGQVQPGLYSGASPVTYEETNANGLGVRLTAVRQYHNWFTQAFAVSSDDVSFFNSGHAVIVSVSNLSKVTSTFTFQNLVSGTYDTAIDAMFDRMFALPFDSNVTTLTRTVGTTNTSANITGTFTGADVGASITGTGIQSSTTVVSQTGTAAVMSKTATATGSPTASIIQGITQPYVYFILQHEVDRGAANGKLYGTDTPADFVAAWQHVWTRCGLRATAASVPRTRVRFCWDITGYNITRSDPYYPGAAYVDVIGVDPYTGPGSPVSFTAMNSTIWPYIRAKNKPMAYCETNYIHSADSAAGQSWWADVATQLNALDISVEFLSIWNAPDSNTNYNFQKAASASTAGHAYPLIHAGIATMIANVGNNAIRTAVTQALPSAPSGIAVASSADGKSATMTWATPPAGDNITSWKPFLGSGTTTTLTGVVSSIPATPRSYVLTGLTPGTAYTANLIAVNAAGKSGYGNFVNFTTSVPGATNHAPSIASFTAVPETANPLMVDFNLTASDPDGNPLTNTVVVTAAAVGFSETFTMTSGVQATRTYANPSTYTATVTVSDGTLATTATQTFPVTVGAIVVNTPTQQWPLAPFQPKADSRGVGAGLLGILNDLDSTVAGLQARTLSAWNTFYNLAGSAFDPISAATTVGLAASTLWYTMVRLEATTFSGVVALLDSPPLTGTGLHVGIHDANGNVLIDDQGNKADFSGTAVDAWLAGTPAAPARLTFPTGSIINRTFGEFLYVSLYLPPGVSVAPTLYGAISGGVAISSLAPAPVNRYGNMTGYSSGIPSTLPFASAGLTTAPLWFGLIP